MSDFYKSSYHFKTFIANTAIIVILSVTTFVHRVQDICAYSSVVRWRRIAYVIDEQESFVRVAVSRVTRLTHEEPTISVR